MLLQTKVLVAEDNGDDSFFIRDALINLHCDFECASSMEEAREKTNSFKPEVVILDVGLPRSHGSSIVDFSEIEAYIRDFKAQNAIVILTGAVNQDHVHRAMTAGACDYLGKDILRNRVEFESRIREAHTLHTALGVKNDMASVLLNQAGMRAAMETLSKKFDRNTLKVGEVQDKKDELLKKQIRDTAIKDRDAYWKRRIWALINIVFWGIAYAIKYGLEKLTFKH